jgi:hypothetical protein
MWHAIRPQEGSGKKPVTPPNQLKLHMKRPDNMKRYRVIIWKAMAAD